MESVFHLWIDVQILFVVWNLIIEIRPWIWIFLWYCNLVWCNGLSILILHLLYPVCLLKEKANGSYITWMSPHYIFFFLLKKELFWKVTILMKERTRRIFYFIFLTRTRRILNNRRLKVTWFNPKSNMTYAVMRI